MKYLLFSLRPAQWIKNFFIFLPLIFGKKLFVFPDNIKTTAAFFIFCIATSAAYLANDIIDAEEDRAHPTKKLRPIASGRVGIPAAKLAALILGIASLCPAFLLDRNFGLVVAAYLAGNILYSRLLKTAVIIDVFCLAFFFYLRIEAGSIVSSVKLSHWILFMTVLLALFLGLNKRRQELIILANRPAPHRIVLTQYTPYFIDQMTSVITSSIVVVYMLYTVDTRTVNEFGTSHLIYSIPFVYYGIFRYLYLIHKIKKEGDPTRILLSDKMMLLNIALWVGVCISVIYFGL